MALFRQVRPKHRIKVSGPATIVVVGGRAALEIHHAPATKVEHQRPAVVEVETLQARVAELEREASELRQERDLLKQYNDAYRAQMTATGHVPYLDRMNELVKRAEAAEQERDEAKATHDKALKLLTDLKDENMPADLPAAVCYMIDHSNMGWSQLGELLKAAIFAREACRDNLSMYMYKNEPLLLEAMNKIDDAMAGMGTERERGEAVGVLVLTEAEADVVLERWDQTHPDMQRKIVAALIQKIREIEAEREDDKFERATQVE